MKFLISVGIVAVLASCFVGGFFLNQSLQENPLSSVEQASEYNSTTTYNGTPQILHLTTTSVFYDDGRAGTLGSVMITAAGASIDLYDATTTNINLRAATQTTSSIRLGSFLAEAAAGTYTFDTFFRRGLIVVFGSTDVPTSTVTFR